MSVHKFLSAREETSLSLTEYRYPGLIGRRRPLTAVITSNRLAICAARVSTADRTNARDVTTGKCNRPLSTLHSSARMPFSFPIPLRIEERGDFACITNYLGDSPRTSRARGVSTRLKVRVSTLAEKRSASITRRFANNA